MEGLSMFLYRVKVEELDAIRLTALKLDLTRGEENLRALCPIREMSVVSDDRGSRELDIYFALDDFIGSEQLRSLVGELNTLLDVDTGRAPRISSELVHI